MKKTLASLVFLFVIAAMTFARPQEERIALRFLVVSTEDEATRIRSQIEIGASFDRLARSASLDPSAENGGYLGELSVGDLREELQSAADGLGSGQVSPVFRLDAQYALLQRLSRAEVSWIAEREAGLELARDGRYAEATDRFEAARTYAEQFGAEDLRLATSLNDLAEVHRLQGDAPSSIPLYRRAIAIWESVLGGDHPELATPLNNLAEAYRSEGDYAEAEPLYRRSVAIWQRVFGSDHGNVATGLNNLALALQADKRLAEADSLFRRALEIRERSPGPGNTELAAVLHNLASLRRVRGDYADAEPLARRSLAILERGLGPNHYQLIPSLDGLAELSWMQGNFAESGALYERALNIRWGGGGDRPAGELASVLVDLIDLLDLGFVRDARFEEAFDSYFAKANAVFSGPELHVAASGVLVSAGLDDAGEALLLNAVERFPVSWRTRFRLGEFYADSGSYLRALEEFGNTLKMDAPMSIRYRVLTRMGDLHRDLDELDASLAAYRQAVALGQDDATATIGMGLLHRREDRQSEALAAFELAAQMSPKSAEAHYRRADAYLALDRWRDAAAAAGEAVALNPAHRRAHYLLGRALIRSGRPDDGQLALRDYTRLEAEESSREARLLKSVRIRTGALEAFRVGDSPTAIALLKDGIESHSEFPDLRLALGLVQFRLGQHRSAIQTLRSIAEGDRGGDSLVHRVLARAHAMLGNTASSQRHRALYLQRIRKELETQIPR